MTVQGVTVQGVTVQGGAMLHCGVWCASLPMTICMVYTCMSLGLVVLGNAEAACYACNVPHTPYPALCMLVATVCRLRTTACGGFAGSSGRSLVSSTHGS